MVHGKCCFHSCPTNVLSVTSGGTNSRDHFYFKLMARLSDFNIISRMLKVIFLNIFSKSILCFTYFCFTCFNFHLFIKCLNVVGRKHPLFAVCVTLNSLSCNFIFLFLKSMGVHILVNLRRVPILCCNYYFMLTTQQASLPYHMTTSWLFIDLSFLKHNGCWTVSSLLVKGLLGLISKSKPLMSLELCYALLLISVLSNL